MKRLMAALLCMLLVLAPAALAAGKDATISNMSITVNGEEYALNGIELVFGTGETDDAAGVRIAVNANGETAADLSLELLGDKIIAYADGVSDVYSIDLQTISEMLDESMAEYNVNWEEVFQVIEEKLPEMLEKWSASIDKITEVVAGGIAEDGTVDLNGETATHYVISIGEDDMQTLISELSALLSDFVTDLDVEVEGVALDDAESGAKRFSVEGTADVGETVMAAEIRVFARDEETGETETLVVVLNSTSTEEDGKTTRKMDSDIYAETEEGMESLLTQSSEVYLVDEAFVGMEYKSENQDGGTKVIKLTMPEDQSADGTYGLYILVNSETELNIEANDALFHLTLTRPDGALSLNADKTGEGTTHVAFEAAAEGKNIALSFDAALAESDAAWMKTAVEETVDVFTMDEEQAQKLLNEVGAKSIELIGAIAGSSEALATAMGDAM